jgi:hypothetical protein
MLTVSWQSHSYSSLSFWRLSKQVGKQFHDLASPLFHSWSLAYEAVSQYTISRCADKEVNYWMSLICVFMFSRYSLACGESYFIQSNWVKYLKDFTRLGKLGFQFNFTEQILPNLYSCLHSNWSNSQPVTFYFLYTGPGHRTVAMFKEVQDEYRQNQHQKFKLLSLLLSVDD